MELFWRLLPAVRPGERERFLLFLGLGAALSFAQTVGITATEAIFLSRVGPAQLPETFVLAAAVTTAASLLYAIRIGEAMNDDVLAELLLLVAVLAAALGVAAWAEAPAAPKALLCLQIASQAILLSHLSELSGDCFHRLSSKRVTPLFMAGVALGAAAGGAVTLALAPHVAAHVLVLVWSGALLGVLVALRLARPRIRSMSPLGLEEDAHSYEGVRAAARYLGASSFGRLLVLSTVLMVGALTVLRLLYSDVIVQAFPDERALTAFLAEYQTVANLAQVLVPLWITPWLIARLGVPSANLLHPLLTFGFSAGLFASQQLPMAIGARATAEVLENAFAGPVRNLVYGALPERLSARAGAYLGGVVMQAALFAGGATLLAARRFDPAQLALLAALLSLAYLLGHLRMRRAYVEALVGELRAGRLDLDAIGHELGRQEVSRLAALWNELGTKPDAGALRMLAELAPFLAARGVVEPLTEALRHPEPALRAAALDALRGTTGALSAPDIVRALSDPDARVRAAAIAAAASGLAAEPGAGESVRAALRALLADPEPDLAAAAAAALGAEGEPRLSALAGSGDPRAATAALALLPAPLAPLARARLEDASPAVRAAARACAARHAAAFADDTERIGAGLADSAPRVRIESVRALAASPDPDALAIAARALADPTRSVRAEAVAALSARGPHGAALAQRRLDPEEPRLAREAALETLHRVGTTDARALVAIEQQRTVREAWSALLALRALPADVPPGSHVEPTLRWLRAAESDALASAVRLHFRILQLLEDAAVTRTVERTLRFGPERLRFEALEVLSHLGDRESAERLVLLLEPGPLEEKLRGIQAFVRPPRNVAEVVASARDGATRWLRLAARATAGESPGSKEELMERLVFLRGVTLFSNLSLDQLEAVERITREELFVENERIVREGDPGEELYLVLEGEVSIFKDLGGPSETRLNVLGPGSYFGEMSILDQRPRSATAVATRSSRVLVLAGDRLRELVLEQPELCFEILRVLTARVRAAEGRLSR